MRRETFLVGRQNTIHAFFDEFSVHVRPFFRKLVAAYKKDTRHDLPVLIADYYDDRHDKEIAVLSTLCMRWDSDSIYVQVRAMMDIMGEHPWEWFLRRLFVNISRGNCQETPLEGGGARYWKIARMFDRFYMHFCECGAVDSIGECFRGRGAVRFDDFMSDVFEEIGYKDTYSYRTNVVELVLRASDGIGLGLWGNTKARLRCPRTGDVFAFLNDWIPDYNYRSWDFDSTIRWFGLESDTDFFQFWLAWRALSRKKPHACARLSFVFRKRLDDRRCFSACRWRLYFPEIEF